MVRTTAHDRRHPRDTMRHANTTSRYIIQAEHIHRILRFLLIYGLSTPVMFVS